MKKQYEKPSMCIIKLQHHTYLLQASNLGGNNPFNWGSPDDDR